MYISVQYHLCIASYVQGRSGVGLLCVELFFDT